MNSSLLNRVYISDNVISLQNADLLCPYTVIHWTVCMFIYKGLVFHCYMSVGVQKDNNIQLWTCPEAHITSCGPAGTVVPRGEAFVKDLCTLEHIKTTIFGVI